MIKDVLSLGRVTIASLEHLRQMATEIESSCPVVRNEAFGSQLQALAESALVQATLVETAYPLDRASELQALTALRLARDSLIGIKDLTTSTEFVGGFARPERESLASITDQSLSLVRALQLAIRATSANRFEW
jgi:hypothetical protein